MREIKFRGKARGEWVYCSLIVCEDGHCVINWVDGLRHVSTDIGVVPETVGQFTGHCDVMGTDMYEGDIVTGYFEEDEWPAVVEWDEVCARFVLSGQNSVIPFDEMGGLEVTIIGNIHDNPNLLGATE